MHSLHNTYLPHLGAHEETYEGPNKLTGEDWRLTDTWRPHATAARCLDVFSRGDVVQALFRYTSPGTTCGNSKGDQHDRFS